MGYGCKCGTRTKDRAKRLRTQRVRLCQMCGI
nr:MAG TPA: Telomere stability C-terminal [Caudoviricetes sp.]